MAYLFLGAATSLVVSYMHYHLIKREPHGSPDIFMYKVRMYSFLIFGASTFVIGMVLLLK